MFVSAYSPFDYYYFVQLSDDMILTIRFLKVKEELRVMREERTKKENAYRLMQRESKQCDTIQKELVTLKESKVLYSNTFNITDILSQIQN